jgi:N-methylhydantoinase A
MGVWTALSLVDVESIGAGGGSVGWIDARGMLRVGPGSAGAVPGPACYARGGHDATVTDALVVLGYIDPDRFLGGTMALDADAARAACARLGEPLALDAEETAWGMRELALAGMVKAVRSRLVDRGLDPREHSLVSYGGSGSLFTPDIAAAIGVPRVLVPELASVLSAFGAATTDIRRERLRSVLAAMPVDTRLIDKLMDELRSEIHDDLAEEGVGPTDRRIEFEAHLRFSRQVWEIQVPLPDEKVDAAVLDQLLEAFRGEYAKRYGQGSIVLGAPIELVSLGAIGHGRTVQARLDAGHHEPVPAGTLAASAGAIGTRAVRLARGPAGDGVRDVPVLDGGALRPGHVLWGPALVDGSDTTVWIPEGLSAQVDPYGTLILELAP